MRFLDPSDTNIFCFSIADDGEALSRSNPRTEALFAAFHASAAFSVSKTNLGAEYAAQKARHLAAYGGVPDAVGMVMIRCVFMNPYWASPDIRDHLIPEFIALVRAAASGGAPRPEFDLRSVA